MKSFIHKSSGLPVGAVATTVGLATLANAYLAVGGYTLIRHLTMIGAVFIWLAATIKITVYFSTFKGEYTNVIPSSLYGTFSMLTMILGSYFFDFHEGVGRFVWLTGIGLHLLHILIFTYQFSLKGIKKETFIPTWFVTYVGLLVSAVVGVPMGMPQLITVIVYYGFGIMAVMLPFMLYRLIKNPLPKQHQLTATIVVAPCSLCLIGYLNISPEPVPAIVFIWYLFIILALIYIGSRLPRFLKMKFNPGFASLTFPLAISLVASIRMSGFLMMNGMETLGAIVREFSGVQLYMSTGVIGYVAYHFLRLGVLAFQKKE